ncbi:MAG: DUF1648 domain-containing protein [Ethanoligenens sp.]
MKKRFPLTRFQLVCEILLVVLATLPFILLSLYWNKIPNKIPTHFGITGAADAWGGKECIWIVPCMAAGLYWFITLLFLLVPPSACNTPEYVTDENHVDYVRIMRWMMLFVKLCMLSILYQTLWTQVHAFATNPAWSLPLNLGILLGGVILFLIYTHKKFSKKTS